MKTYMLQYFDGYKTVENTEPISEEEALALWDKVFDKAKARLMNGFDIQLCIWKDCKSNTDYHTVLKEIDYRDCVVERGRIYKVEKIEVK